MKTLEQIKNDYAVSKGYLSWKGLLAVLSFDLDFICKHENEVMKIYAMECLKLASEKIDTSCFRSQSDYIFTVKEITNENNIIK